MPKLDLPNAVRIKTESGEVTRLKGSAFNWSSPHYSGVEHATLTGDFKRGHYVADDSKVDTLDQSFDYSGGLGTMVDSDGVLKWQPHNLVAYSEDFTQSDWSASKLNSGIAPVVTSNYATAPDGTETADRIVFDSGGTTSSDWSFIRQLNSGLTATDHTFVVFVKSTDGTDQNLEFHINGGQAGSITATSEWQAVSYEYTHTNYFGLMVDGDGSQQTADILVWGAHLYRSDLGGMVAVPVAERGLSTSSTYLPTKADPIPATPELVTNGEDWTGATASTPPTGWTSDGTTQFTISSEALRITRNSGDGTANQNITCTVGKTYVAQFEVLDTLTQDARMGITGVAALTVPNGSTGVYDLVFTATLATHELYLQAANNLTADVTIDNVSVKELRYDPSSPRYLPRVGEHKYDSTTAKWNAHNLLAYSEDFSKSNWAASNASVTVNAAVAPDGTTSADGLSDNGSTGLHGLSQAYTALSGTEVSFSVFAKAANISHVRLTINTASGANGSAFFNVSDGSVGSQSGGTNTIEHVGGGIYKCTTSGTLTTTNPSLGIYLSDGNNNQSYTGTGAVGVYLWGAHHYRSDLNGVVANSGNDLSGLYVPTTATATEPTLNTEVSYKNKGLRLESEARTNLFTYSSDLSNGAWTNPSTTVGSITAGGPTGTYQSFTSPGDSASPSQVYQIGKTLVSGNPYCLWAIVKHSALDAWAVLNIYDTTDTNTRAWFDIQTGVVGTAEAGITDHGIVDFGDGWYLIWAYKDAGSTSGGGVLELVDGDNVTSRGTGDEMLVAATQFEAGDTPSTYIPTTGATLTRPAETFETPAGTVPWSGISNTTVRREADYVSGYLPTDTKGAWLSDTDDTDVTGTELVTNGTFDTDASGWTTFNVTPSVGSGEVTLTIDGGSSAGGIYQVITAVAGEQYVVTADARVGTGAEAGLWLYDNNVLSGTRFEADTASGTTETLSNLITPTNNYFLVYLRASDAAGETVVFDNLSVRLADPDRSTNDNGLAINGTITKTPVATGAELVAYSGFSASDYLEQPYNSDLDFGTGDFCVMGWVKQASGSVDILLSKSPASSIVSPYFELQLQSDGTIDWMGNNSTSKLSSSSDVCTDEWRFICVVRDSGTGRLFVDGTLEASAANTDDYDHSNADTLRVGYRQDSYSGTLAGSLALLRIAGSAPTAAEILEIYNREKVLFEDGTTASRVIDTELITNGTFDTDTGWTKGTGWTISGGVATHAAGTGSDLTLNGLPLTTGTPYVLTLDVTAVRASSTLYVIAGDPAFYQTIEAAVTPGTKTVIFEGPTNGNFTIRLGGPADADIDNISVKEYTPAAITDMQTPEVTIRIKGEIDYVDNDTGTGSDGVSAEKVFFTWRPTASNYIFASLATNNGTTGEVVFIQEEGSTVDSVRSSTTDYSPGLNVPFNIASYHEVNKINGAVDATALTANTTPVSLPDLSATDLKWGFDFMGTIEHINVWDTSEEDTGIVYITE